MAFFTVLLGLSSPDREGTVMFFRRSKTKSQPSTENLGRFIKQYEVVTADPVVDAHLQQAQAVLGEEETNGDVYLRERELNDRQ